LIKHRDSFVSTLPFFCLSLSRTCDLFRFIIKSETMHSAFRRALWREGVVYSKAYRLPAQHTQKNVIKWYLRLCLSLIPPSRQAVRSSEALAMFYQTTRRHIPESDNIENEIHPPSERDSKTQSVCSIDPRPYIKYTSSLTLKLSLQQAMKTHRVVRRPGSHIF
jgi:hypothetical protein